MDASGTTVAELEPKQWRRAGARTIVFDGRSLPDGAYVVHVTANATGGRTAAADVPVVLTRTLGRIALASPAMTPNGDGRDDTLSLTVPLTAPAGLTVRILRDGRWVATPFEGTLGPGSQVVTWDGRKRLGPARDGSYVAAVEVVDAVGTATVRDPVRPRRDGAGRSGRLGGAAPHLGLRGGDARRPCQRRAAGACAPTARARSASPESSGSGRSSSSRGTRPGTRRPSGAERRLGDPRQ